MADSGFLGEKMQARDLGAYRDNMREWVSRRMGGKEPVEFVSLNATPPGSNGFAGETFILEVSRGTEGNQVLERLLLKRKPTQHIYFLEHNFDFEARIQEIVARDGRVPMAPFIAYEPQTDTLGSPFYIIGFVDGRPVPDYPFYYNSGWLVDLPAEQQRAICVSTLEALAAIHSIPLEESGAGFLRRAAPGQRQIDVDLDVWDRFSAISWADGPMGDVSEGRRWLEENKPSKENLVISWGDARPGNILFDGVRAAAVIDWDLVSCGDPERSLGYMLAIDLNFQNLSEKVGSGIHLSGWPSRTEMSDIYETLAGTPVDQKKLRYYRIFAAYQIACMYARHVNMRKDLTAEQRPQLLNTSVPSIDLIRKELEHSHLAGCAN